MACMIDDGNGVIQRIQNPHSRWIGCGDMCRRSSQALSRLAEEFSAQLTFIDVLDPDLVKQPPPSGAVFFNIARPEQLAAFRIHLTRHPVTHIYIANLPFQHLPTAFVLAEKCPAARIIIAKPLDINLHLIETLAGGAVWPGVTERLFEHDHYRNKGAVIPVYKAFPELIKAYGRVTKFEFYLIEYQTVEEGNRVDALRDGVIFDLATHLFALAHLFFLNKPYPGLFDPGLDINKVSMRINRVARARYARCQIDNVDAETFAAIDITLLTEYSRPGRTFTLEVPGLIAVGKGIRPSSRISASLKGLRFEQELQSRSVNLARNEVNPPLSDLAFVKEDGFTTTIVNALTKDHPAECSADEHIAPVVTFSEAAGRGRLLGAVMRASSRLQYYRAGDTLDSVMAQCVAGGTLDPSWLSEGGYAEIGYAA